MELNQQTIFLLSLTPEEMRLICKALGGRLKPEEREAAQALDTLIARNRVAQGETRWREISKLKENLEAV